MDDPAQELIPAELAGCVLRALPLPEVAALRPGLLPELPVHASIPTDTHEEVTTGIADAIAFDSNGTSQVVIDWKSDVDPSPATLEHYRTQGPCLPRHDRREARLDGCRDLGSRHAGHAARRCAPPRCRPGCRARLGDSGLRKS